ncbi:MAG: right-handed parallel beta-helix repeat-containing protein, partial [Candidatus Sumerlaeia bacterium]|nr:right-handed parallel beta-helix repeat-containing protein [Candidatus Sumerlaeia bacterium]
MKNPARLLLVSTLLATGINAAALTQYVSPEGNDDNPGTAEAPLQTLDRALERNATEILMRHGNYFLAPTSTVVPAGVVIRGGLEPYYVADEDETIWAADQRRTVLLKTEIQRTAGFILSPTEGGNMEGGVLEDVTILGGFTSVEMRDGSRMTNVILGGGTSSTVLAQIGNTQLPAILDGVQITGGGGSGVQIAATGSMIIRDTVIRSTGGRGISVTGTGNTLIENSVIQGSNSDGIAILGGNEVTILNNRILRNAESGILVRQTNPTIMGNLIERNDDGLRIINSSESLISQNTVVSNRTSGIFLNRSTPEISYNIIASNQLFGVMEEKELEEPMVGGPLVGNLFWSNEPANYLDEGDDEWDTADELNTNLLNTVPPEGNIVEDPLFT